MNTQFSETWYFSFFNKCHITFSFDESFFNNFFLVCSDDAALNLLQPAMDSCVAKNRKYCQGP